MNPKITPEIQSALDQHPVGPIRMAGDSDTSPVFLVRLDDIANLQELVDGRIREKLAEADSDIEAGLIRDWDPEAIKQRGRTKLDHPGQS